MAITSSQGDHLFADLPATRQEEPVILVKSKQFMPEFINRFRSNQTLFISGSAGQGKSTFVLNELIPMLESGYALNGREKWRIRAIVSNPYPVLALAEAIVDLQQAQTRQDPSLVQELHKALLQQPMAFIDHIQKVLEGLNTNLLFYFDKLQYARSSALEQNEEQQLEWGSFLSIIERVSSQNAYPIHFLATIDEDFTTELLTMGSVSSIVNDGLVKFASAQTDAILHFFDRIREEFFFGIEDRCKEEIITHFEKDSCTNADMSVLLRSMHTAYVNDPKADVDMSYAHYKKAGGIDQAFNKAYQKAFKSLNTEEKKLFESSMQLLIQRDHGSFTGYTARSLTLNEIASAIESSPQVLATVFSKMNTSSVTLFAQNDLNRIEHRLSKLKDSTSDSEKESLNNIEVRLANAILIERIPVFKKWADTFYRDLDYLKEIIEDISKEEPPYKGRKLERALSWRKTTLIGPVLGPILTSKYHDALAFIETSDLEAKKLQRRAEAEEASRLQKEKRFRLVVGVSLFLVIGSMVVFSWYGKRLLTKRQELITVSDTLKIKTDKLEELQLKADSAAVEIKGIQKELTEKEFETRQNERELKLLVQNMEVKEDSLKAIEDTLEANKERQVRLISDLSKLNEEATELSIRAINSKNEAELSSSINRINAMIFSADLKLRNRSSLDQNALIEAGFSALMAYDSLESVLYRPFSMSQPKDRFANTERQLYNLITNVYSQISNSTFNDSRTSRIDRGRALVEYKNGIYVADNIGGVFRLTYPLEMSEKNSLSEAETQLIDYKNRQVRQILPLNEDNQLLLRLADGEVVWYDFYYNQIVEVLDKGSSFNLSIHPPFYTLANGSVLSLIGSRLVQFEKTNSSFSSSILLQLDDPLDPWLNMAYHQASGLLVLRVANKTFQVHKLQAQNNSFKLVQEVYLEELATDVSSMLISDAADRMFIGLQDGTLGLVELSNETGQIEPQSWLAYSNASHEGTVIHLREDPGLKMLFSSGMDSRILVSNSTKGGIDKAVLFEIQEIQPAHQLLYSNQQLISVSSSLRFNEDDYKGRIGFWPLDLPKMARKLQALYKAQQLSLNN